nr:reverse transcriptase domain-containing protein [Tanacetum cinerariifolium]
MPTYRTTTVDVVNNDEELRLNLDLLEERWELAAINEARSKSKMTKYYNSQVKNKREKDKIVIKPDQIKKKGEAWRSQEKFKAVTMDKGRKNEENAKRMVENAYTVKKLLKFKKGKKRQGPNLQIDQSSSRGAISITVVSKSSAVSAADAPNQRQHHTTPLKNHTTPAPTCQVQSLEPTVISSENINQAEAYAENDQVADDELINILSTPVQDQGETSSCHEELHQFDRLDVWELVDRLLCTNVINLKWLWKNKYDEENTVI